MTGVLGRFVRRTRDGISRTSGRTVLLAFLMAGFCWLSASMLWTIRSEVRNSAVREAHNVLVAEADQIGWEIGIYDASLRSAARILQDRTVLSAEPHLQQLALFDRVREEPDFGPVRIVDERGVVVHDSSTLHPPVASTAERTALASRSRDGGPGLAIALSAPSGAQAGVIVLSYRLSRPDGTFGGIVAGSIRLTHFIDRFRKLRLGEHDVVSLFLRDGIMIAHAPGDPLIGRSIAGSVVMRHFASSRGGTFAATAALDGIDRIFSFVTIGDLPLILDIGLSVEDLYRPWKERAIGTGVLLLVMAALSLAVLRNLGSEIRMRVRAQADATASERQYRLLADNVSDVIFRFDDALVRTYVSPSCRSLGYEPHELVGRAAPHWIHPDDQEAFRRSIHALRSSDQPAELSYRIRLKDGAFVWIENSYRRLPQGGFVSVLRNIDRRRQAEAELEQARLELARLVAIDGLTGVRNRRSFETDFQNCWRKFRRDGSGIALLMIDVDHFKAYNDTYGHQAGDLVLRNVAGVIDRCLRRPGDLIARYGGEEFVAILPDTDLNGAVDVAEAIRSVVAQSEYEHRGASHGVVTVSIGVSAVRAGDQLVDRAQLLKAADECLYLAKATGRNTVRARPSSGPRLLPASCEGVLARTAEDRGFAPNPTRTLGVLDLP